MKKTVIIHIVIGDSGAKKMHVTNYKHFFVFLWLSNHSCITLLMKDTDPFFFITSFSIFYDIRKYFDICFWNFSIHRKCHNKPPNCFWGRVSFQKYTHTYTAAITKFQDLKMYGIDEILNRKGKKYCICGNQAKLNMSKLQTKI